MYLCLKEPFIRLNFLDFQQAANTVNIRHFQIKDHYCSLKINQLSESFPATQRRCPLSPSSRKANGQVTRAHKALGISRKCLYCKIKGYTINTNVLAQK